MTIDVLKAIPNDPKRNSVAPNLTTTRSSVRRSLFGEVNHEESMEFLKKELEAISKGQKERWNFDFVNEKPINESGSNYEWVPVQQDEVIPKPYALSRLPYLCKNAEILEKDNCNYSQSEEVICRNMSLVQCRIQNNEVTLPKTKLTQTTIHDYLKSKKRPSHCSLPKSNKTECLCSGSSPNYTDNEESEGCNCYHHSSSKRIRVSSTQN